MVEPIKFSKLRITGDGSAMGTIVWDEAGNALSVSALRWEVDADTGVASLFLRIAEPFLEVNLDLTPVERREYE